MIAADVVGDSIAVGMRPVIERRADVGFYEAEVGRSVDTVVKLLARRDVRGRVLLVSAGTNDLYRDATWFRRRVRKVKASVGSGCVVWGLIQVPDTYPLSPSPFNRVLRSEAGPRFRLVRPVSDTTDGVHPTEAGAERLAARFIDAAGRCRSAR